MSDWPKLPLIDALDTLIDYRGKSPKKSTSGIPVISAKVVKAGRVLTEIEQTIAPDYYAKWMRRGLPQIGDVVMTTEGPLGEVARLDENTSRYALGQRIVTMRGKANVLDNGYLKYLLLSPLIQNRLESRATGTTVLGISQKALREMSIPIAPIDEQREIAAILGALDHKIELNRKTAATLEEMARALYRSWFVDFDPVHAKAAGLPPAHMDEATAALFPNRFSEDGLPEGWRNGTLGEIATNPKKGAKATEMDPATPYIGLEHMPRKSVAIAEWGTAADITSNKTRMQKGQFLFGKLRPYFHKVGIAPADGVCSTDILVVDAIDDLWRSFVLSVISSDELVAHTTAVSNGARMPRAKWQDLSDFEITVPTHEVAAAFRHATGAVYEKILATIYENQNLATLRDTLLPRLMSGELRVGEAREQVEEAV